jgi:AraC-type DNA-binding domain-containing proteins
MNYTSFVNKFRIEEAMNILSSEKYKDLNMEDISDMVGFSNRQSFYASFYRINGMTPREYKLSAQKSAIKNAADKDGVK